MEYPNAKLTYPKPTDDQPLFAVFLQGIQTLYVPIDPKTGEITFPSTLTGFCYILVTTQSEGILDDEKTVAGPAILAFPFDSDGKLIIDKVAVA